MWPGPAQREELSLV